MPRNHRPADADEDLAREMRQASGHITDQAGRASMSEIAMLLDRAADRLEDLSGQMERLKR